MTLESDVKNGSACRVEGLDVLRGLAILMVIFSHFLPAIFLPLKNNFTSALGDGGVLLFFYLSGFLIFRNVQSQAPGVFLLRRFFKLFPAYWINIIAICIVALTFHANVATDAKTVLSNLLMLQEFTHSPLVNKVFWTLQIEVKFYLIIVAFCAVCGAGRIYYLMALLLAVNMAVYPVLDRGSTLITYLVMFFPGISAARGSAVAWSSSAYREMILVTVLASINALVFLAEVHVYQAVYAVIFGGLLTLALNMNFVSRLMSFFGRISYSHYLYHAAIGYPMITMLLPFAVGTIQQAIIFIFALIVTTMIAAASFYCVEKPSISFGHALERILTDSKNNLLSRLFQKQPVRV